MLNKTVIPKMNLLTKFSQNRFVKGITLFIPFDLSHRDLSFGTSFVTLPCVYQNLIFTISIKNAHIRTNSSKTIRITLFYVLFVFNLSRSSKKVLKCMYTYLVSEEKAKKLFKIS